MISKISYNNDLYVVGEPIAISDTVEGNIYVPIDDVEAWKELNDGKNIVGYNYNVKRITQDEYLPKVTTIESNELNVINIFNGQKCNQISFTKKFLTHPTDTTYYNFLSFPFDVSVKEIKSAFGEHTVNIYSNKQITITSFQVNDNRAIANIFFNLGDELSEETIIRSGEPLIIKLDDGAEQKQLITITLTFNNKEVKINNLQDKKICGVGDFWFICSAFKQYINWATGKSTASNYLIVSTNGIVYTAPNATCTMCSAWIEYRGEIPAKYPIE